MNKVMGRAIVTGTLLSAGAAFAQTSGTTVDASGVLAGISAASVVTAIVAAGAIYALPGFAKWAIKKVAGFFG
ncbi:hypothetical protein [Cupriavidus taiwanensis]|uniref:hypothetical protein n=1 Tax=Cupriavidus taiwanensis TaxID=164546 RepID=UPI00040F1E40|nr:hypothetical protein [Cupriavidus taiwanensis]SOZ12723.1 conserved exported protein of unknown function [Cupriavidus taiwanensis]